MIISFPDKSIRTKIFPLDVSSFSQEIKFYVTKNLHLSDFTPLNIPYVNFIFSPCLVSPNPIKRGNWNCITVPFPALPISANSLTSPGSKHTVAFTPEVLLFIYLVRKIVLLKAKETKFNTLIKTKWKKIIASEFLAISPWIWFSRSYEKDNLKICQYQSQFRTHFVFF